MFAFQGETLSPNEDDDESLPGRFEIERVLFSIETCQHLLEYMLQPDEEMSENPDDDEQLTLLCIMLSNSKLSPLPFTV